MLLEECIAVFMMKTNKKIFISGGCSFSQVPNADVTWPVHLQEKLNFDRCFHTGLGAAGNRVISRLVINQVIDLLETGCSTEEILVGIMWSGRSRMDVYTTDAKFPHNEIPVTDTINCNYQNPTWLNDQNRYQYLLHAGWDDPSSKLYFENFYDETGAMIHTIEQVLRTQWFLESKGIDYFMMEYSLDCITEDSGEIISKPDVKPLFDQIDFANWPCNFNLTQWAIRQQIPYAREGDDHPSTQAHSSFVDSFVIPHLKHRDIVS